MLNMCRFDSNRTHYNSDYAYYVALIHNQQESFAFESISNAAKTASVDNGQALMTALKNLCANGLVIYKDGRFTLTPATKLIYA